MEEEQDWQVIDGVCETQGGEGQQVYGVRVSQGGCTVGTWADVTDSYEAAARLARRMQRVQPAPCHWDDIVRDYIHSLY